MAKGRPKGSKNKIAKEKDMRERTTLRIDLDIDSFLRSKPTMGVYINELIRQDMKRAIENGEYIVEPVNKEL